MIKSHFEMEKSKMPLWNTYDNIRLTQAGKVSSSLISLPSISFNLKKNPHLLITQRSQRLRRNARNYWKRSTSFQFASLALLVGRVASSVSDNQMGGAQFGIRPAFKSRDIYFHLWHLSENNHQRHYHFRAPGSGRIKLHPFLYCSFSVW